MTRPVMLSSEKGETHATSFAGDTRSSSELRVPSIQAIEYSVTEYLAKAEGRLNMIREETQLSPDDCRKSPCELE